METGSHENGSGVGEGERETGVGEGDAGVGVPPEQPTRRVAAAAAPIHRPDALIEYASFHPAEEHATSD